MAYDRPVSKDFEEIDQIYDECINYLKTIREYNEETSQYTERILNNIIEEDDFIDPAYETIDPRPIVEAKNHVYEDNFKVENETKSMESINSNEIRSERLRRLSQQLPKIIITNSTTSLNGRIIESKPVIDEPKVKIGPVKKKSTHSDYNFRYPPSVRHKSAYGDYPKRLVAKGGMENVALISNVPFEKMRLLNDTFHTLINLRWRWIVMATVILHFAIWLVFAGFWYIAALAHYDFEPDAPQRSCVTGGKDFVTIFLASVEAQTTIGFGDRAIDEECPESIFLLIMQLILGTGLSGVLTCVVYAKLTRPEKLSKDGVGFSKKAVISMRDGRLCLMARVWDLNYDHIISSELTAYFISTHKTKEGELVRHYAKPMCIEQQLFILWPVTVVHVIDELSPLYHFTPQMLANTNFEITVSLKGASASMGTFTQSQTSYLPREIIWGHKFLPVVKFDSRKMKYVIDDKKLEATEEVETPVCSASKLYCVHSSNPSIKSECSPSTPTSFSEKVSGFTLERSSSFRRREKEKAIKLI